MKMLFVISFLSFSVAQAGQVFLGPGQSINIGGGTQVYCQSNSDQPPASPVNSSLPPCEVRYNPAGNTCGAYVVYSNGLAATECLNDLDSVRHQLHDLQAVGTCSRPLPQACSVKFNPAGNTCGSYVIYNAQSQPISGCLDDIDQDVEPVMRQLKISSICQ